MKSFYNYYIAKKRLAMTEETIQMMGGENECQPMLLGQRDMIQLEIEYYREEMNKFTIFLLTFAVAIGIMVSLYVKGMLHAF
jgi:hypothetical protein